MRLAFRWTLAAMVVASVVAMPGSARAWGSYLDFPRRYYVPGQTAVGTSTVFIPRAQQDILDQGPFYAFLTPGPTSIQEGQPIPDTAILLGEFTVEHVNGRRFDVRVPITVPDLQGRYYSVQICNVPCTVEGFRDSMTGYLSIAQTEREGKLLTETWDLRGKIWGLRRDLRKTERALGRVRETLENVSVAATQRRSELRRRLALMGRELQLRRAASSRGDTLQPRPARPLIGEWTAAGLGGGILLLGATVAVRRRRAPHPPAI